MHIISRKRLKDFWEAGHADAEQPLRAWFAITRAARWSAPADIKQLFPHASFLADNRVCFNIGGNKYPLIVRVMYSTQRVYVRFVGTHAEYDKIDANEV